MPTSSNKDTDDASSVVQMPLALAERLVAAMERIAAGQTAEAAAEFRTAWLTELNESNVRLQTQALATIADRLSTVIQAPPPAHHGRTELSSAQKRAVLTYDAFRTALGRPGAAVLVTGVRSAERPQTITITAGSLPDVLLTLVCYDPSGSELGRGPLPPATSKHEPRQAQIATLEEKDVVARFEILDQAGDPIHLGLLQPPARIRPDAFR